MRVNSSATRAVQYSPAYGRRDEGAFLKSRRLFELAVVYPLLGTALLLLVAVAAVPFWSDRGRASESAAIGTLRSIATAELAFQRAGYVDTDGNGTGEFGTFEELSGGKPMRGYLGRDILDPPLLSPLFRATDGEGTVRRGGFAFRLYLPARDGGWVCASLNARKVAATGAEKRFCAFAWPLERTERHGRIFRVDQTGTVRATHDPVPPAALHAADASDWRAVR